MSLLDTPERTGNSGSIRQLALTRLRGLPIEASPAWAEIVGKLLYNRVGNVLPHLQGEQYMRAKPVISYGNQ